MEGNSYCTIRDSKGKGRGLFASRQIPIGTIIETSPTLLFSKTEYQEHGRHTILDHYTFNWPDGRMALALGLGSLFNHSESPNVSFSLNTKSECIRYTSTKRIATGEELCIFYGHKLWFTPAEHSHPQGAPTDVKEKDDWDTLRSIMSVESTLETDLEAENPFAGGDPEALIPDKDLPFMRTKVLPDDEEEDEIIKTMDVWVVDMPDPRKTQSLLKWLHTAGLETLDLAHLKRVRRPLSPPSSDQIHASPTLLLASVHSHPSPPTPPESFELPRPYQIAVPKYVALTPKSHKLKLSIWPTIYAPRVKGKPEPWSRGKAAWAWDALQVVLKEAIRVKEANEYPIVSYVPRPYMEAGSDTDTYEIPLLLAHDTRRSTKNPLRHSVLNVVRKVADWRSSQIPRQSRSREVSLTSSSESTASPDIDQPGHNIPANGAHYLLTSLTLFTTHEPCIMCSMALLHSRVKEIIFVHPMNETGGSGGESGHGTCVPRLPSVNHRYSILRWSLRRRFDLKQKPHNGGEPSEANVGNGSRAIEESSAEGAGSDEGLEDLWARVKIMEDLDA